MSTDRCMRLKRQPVMITISRRRKLFKQFQAARCQKAPKTGRCVHSHLRRLFADEGVGGWMYWEDVHLVERDLGAAIGSRCLFLGNSGVAMEKSFEKVSKVSQPWRMCNFSRKPIDVAAFDEPLYIMSTRDSWTPSPPYTRRSRRFSIDFEVTDPAQIKRHLGLRTTGQLFPTSHSTRKLLWLANFKIGGSNWGWFVEYAY